MKQEKKIMLLQGNVVEVGQALQNLYGKNPNFKIVEKFESSSVRPIAQSQIHVSANQPQYEPLLIIIMVYENPGDLIGEEFKPAPNVKATLKP